MKAPEPKTKDFEYQIAPEGTHMARLYKIINVGTQKIEWEGQVKEQVKVMLYWELPTEPITYTTQDGEEKTSVFSLSREFTFSMHEKGNLRPIIEGMIGTSLKDEEAYAFDLEDLIGKACLVTVAHKKSKDGTKTYANVTGTAGLMKGQECPPQVNDSSIIDANTIKDAELEELPTWISDKIKLSPEYKKANDIPVIEYPEDGEEVPF